MSKRFLSITLAALTLCFLASSCVKEEGFENRVRAISDTGGGAGSRVATLEEQVAQLSSSIVTLDEEHQKLQMFTAELSEQVAEMEEELANVDAKIAAVKAELEGKLDSQKTELIGILDAYKKDVTGQIDEINKKIKALETRDAELVKKIESLQKFVKDSMVTKDWVNATFATLRQKDSLAGVTAAIKVYAEYVSGRVDSLADEHHKDTTTIFAAIRTLGTKSAQALETAVQTLNNTITTTAATIKEEYTAAIETAVEASEASIKQWVNDTLSDYYTAALVDEKIKVATDGIDTLNEHMREAEDRITALEASQGDPSAIKNIRDSLKTAYTHIQTVRDSLKTLDYKIDTTREKITAAYRSAIKGMGDSLIVVLNDSLTSVKASISTLSGDLKAVTTRVSTLETKMNTVQGQITSIQADIAGLKTVVEKLVARIQKIDVIPDYRDGSVTLNNGWNRISFAIRPDSLAKKLVAGFNAKNTKFTFLMVQTLTKAVTYDTLDVTGVVMETNGTLDVTVRGNKIPAYYYAENGKTGNGCLIISDDVNCNSSGFFPLIRTIYPEFEDTLCVTVNGLTWAPVNCGYGMHPAAAGGEILYSYGLLYQWGRKHGGGYERDAPYNVEKMQTLIREQTANPDSSYFYKGTLGKWYIGSDPLWNIAGRSNYDPCPAGWRVPTYDEMISLMGNSSMIESSAGWDSSKKGYWFNGTKSPKSGEGLFLPAAGFRDWALETCNYRASWGFYWSSKVSDDPYTAAYNLSLKQNVAIMSNDNRRATCYSVRCVLE